jgi:hypothetical protein
MPGLRWQTGIAMGSDPLLSIFNLENLDIIRHRSMPSADAFVRRIDKSSWLRRNARAAALAVQLGTDRESGIICVYTHRFRAGSWIVEE